MCAYKLAVLMKEKELVTYNIMKKDTVFFCRQLSRRSWEIDNDEISFTRVQANRVVQLDCSVHPHQLPLRSVFK